MGEPSARGKINPKGRRSTEIPQFKSVRGTRDEQTSGRGQGKLKNTWGVPKGAIQGTVGEKGGKCVEKKAEGKYVFENWRGWAGGAKSGSKNWKLGRGGRVGRRGSVLSTKKFHAKKRHLLSGKKGPKKMNAGGDVLPERVGGWEKRGLSRKQDPGLKFFARQQDPDSN